MYVYLIHTASNRRWTPELEETVTNVKTQMEQVCDQYFIDIQHQAVKVHTIPQEMHSVIVY